MEVLSNDGLFVETNGIAILTLGLPIVLVRMSIADGVGRGLGWCAGSYRPTIIRPSARMILPAVSLGARATYADGPSIRNERNWHREPRRAP